MCKKFFVSSLRYKVLNLRSSQTVELERDYSCSHDPNAVWAKLILDDQRRVVLGHLEKNIASALVPLMDENFTGFIIRR